MKAALLRAIHEPLTIEEIEIAEPKAGEVLVRIEASGVCHSDLHRIHGDFPSPLPMVMGHEGSGVVEQVGPGVGSPQVGDHVVLSIGPYCGECLACGAGRFSDCPKIAAMRPLGALFDGTSRLSKGDERISNQSFVSSFAEYSVVPATGAIPVRKDAPLDTIALVGCGVTTGVAAVFNDAKVSPGDRVAVFGCGGVGLNAVQAAALSGAEMVIGVDLLDSKLALAEQFGATHTVNASEGDPVEQIRSLTGIGVDHAFEVIGIPSVVLQGMGTLKPGGRMWVLGVLPADAVLEIPWWKLMAGRQGLQFSGFGAANPRADIPRIVDLYMAGKLKLDELITERLPLEQVNDAFGLMERGEVARTLVYPR